MLHNPTVSLTGCSIRHCGRRPAVIALLEAMSHVCRQLIVFTCAISICIPITHTDALTKTLAAAASIASPIPGAVAAQPFAAPQPYSVTAAQPLAAPKPCSITAPEPSQPAVAIPALSLCGTLSCIHASPILSLVYSHSVGLPVLCQGLCEGLQDSGLQHPFACMPFLFEWFAAC